MPDQTHGSNGPGPEGAGATTEHEPSHERPAVENCTTACSVTHDRCLAAVDYCLRRGGDYADARHIRTLLDAAHASEVSRDFMLRGSKLYKLYCRGCAHASEECAKTCERFAGDEVMRACAEACRRCAAACREVGGVQRHESQATARRGARSRP
jgi:hypothetical protein